MKRCVDDMTKKEKVRVELKTRTNVEKQGERGSRDEETGRTGHAPFTHIKTVGKPSHDLIDAVYRCCF